MRLYHVTREANLDAILLDGLLPAIGERAMRIGETAPAIYCFASRETAEDALSNWLGDAFDEDEPLALLEIEVATGVPMEHEAFEVRVGGPIPPSAIRVVARGL